MQDIRFLLPKIILASGSPARKALLEELGIEVQVFATNCDESCQLTEAAQVVRSLAIRKLENYRMIHPKYHLPVLACDTLIALDGNLIGKPQSREDAFKQLSFFSMKVQEVHSGWALWYNDKQISGCDCALVHFKSLDKKTIEAYLDTNQWQGAAGSYRIQGSARSLIDHIEGDAATVIGLPLLQISEILSKPVHQ